ncbi:DNA adenine methylase [Spirosoma oryzicola]|uniref:DNA adenine methylase n=1 Tax=Spirosoma oryzicola TaxID=2898794 RepID=UPI001E3C6351|nr:DNA adenine methylase [Spirosoma oryzicola]UHG93331.1 DNA adenine methylase [Spirosoma oryzicola]
MNPVKPLLKTPISYYGGKQMMLKHILPKIPTHRTYIEPFFGGGAVFWAKPQSPHEVINDISNRLITFYKVLKYDFDELQPLIDETFHSRLQHRESNAEYKSGEVEINDTIRMAWAVWLQANMSFSKTIGSGFAYDRKGTEPLRMFNRKKLLTEAYQERLKRVTIESYDVLKVIKTYDSPDTFFYLDPPYVSSDQGHYKGYTAEDFQQLLEICATMKGKFLLSSYPEAQLLAYRERLGWQHETIVKTLAVDGRWKEKRQKVECLTWNY